MLERQLKIWQFISDSVSAGLNVILMYVLESKGSSPGRQGFMMAVNENGEMSGSIGGGVMEHKFAELAKKELHKKNQSGFQSSIKKQIHDKRAKVNRSGMICSGEQTIYLYHVKQEDKKTITSIIRCMERRGNGTFTISPSGISFIAKKQSSRYQFDFRNEYDFIFNESIGFKNHLHIIGAGHCALAFSELMSKMDFYIHLYDNRPGLNTLDQNSFVQEKILLNDYQEVSDYIAGTENIYVVIMTYGYMTDTIVLRSLINKKVKYIGLLGSKNKVDRMFAELEREGVTPLKLKKVYAPVGLRIKSQTPEEIAVSIAAEIIQIKNAGF